MDDAIQLPAVSSEPTRAGARRLPVGADYLGNGRTHFRVWAPAAGVVVLVHDNGEVGLDPERDGYFSIEAALGPGVRYRFRLGDSSQLLPDPASRFQPEGPHGASEIVDPLAFEWSDGQWTGAELDDLVVYEMHVGTFTREGTWEAAERELPELAGAGITAIEMMPVADFDGRFGWGYDGVDLYAPTRLYGTPDDLRRFIDRAHALGVAVLLDVVYNHLGPAGNYLTSFSPSYFTDRYQNEWGDAINFDGAGSGPVREYFVANAGYWIAEYHFDGLRLDATQQIFDRSRENVIAAVGRRVREAAAGRRTIVLAENEPQNKRLARPLERGGYGIDGLWNDDFHHSAMVALTGHAEAYYSDTTGEPQEFISAAKYGYLYQGQYYAWQRKERGSPAWDLSPAQFVVYLQNHDQVANSARGLRGHQLTSPGRWRAMTALMLLLPSTPMLFQGQEFSASAPFLYFADFDPELNANVRKGRAEFLLQFPSIADFEQKAVLDDPSSPATFARCKLDFSERETHGAAYALHRHLLQVRRDDVAFQTQRRGGVDGAVLSDRAFLLRFFSDNHIDDRVLLVNFGADLCRRSFAEPLLAPPPRSEWCVRWSSEEPIYGGSGTPQLFRNDTWVIPGESAMVLAPQPRQRRRRKAVRRRTA